MALKRKDDYQILTRIEAKQDDMSVTLELLKKDVANIDKSINTDNGVKCIQTRLKGCEDKIVQFNSFGESMEAVKNENQKQQEKRFIIITMLASIPGVVIAIIEIVKHFSK